MMHLTVDILITGEKVSSKSTPYCCVKPLATSLAFNLSTIPSAFYLTLYTHLHPIAFLPLAKEVSFQVSLVSNASTSFFMASIHPVY